jgi:hypothetical protein
VLREITTPSPSESTQVATSAQQMTVFFHHRWLVTLSLMRDDLSAAACNAPTSR